MDTGISTVVSGAFSDVTTFVTGTLAPAAFSLTLLGVGITVAVKYIRKYVGK